MAGCWQQEKASKVTEGNYKGHYVSYKWCFAPDGIPRIEAFLINSNSENPDDRQGAPPNSPARHWRFMTDGFSIFILVADNEESAKQAKQDEKNYGFRFENINCGEIAAKPDKQHFLLGRCQEGTGIVRSYDNSFVRTTGEHSPIPPPSDAYLLWHCRNNDYDNVAIKACTGLIDRKTAKPADLAMAHFSRGESLLNLHRWTDARDDFSAVIGLGLKLEDVGLKRARVYTDRAHTYMRTGDFDLAIADYDVAINIDPSDAFPFRARAAAHVRKQEWSKAVADFSKVISLEPKDATAYYNRGIAHRKNGDEAAAKADQEKAHELDAALVPGDEWK